MALVTVYFVYVYRSFAGKVSEPPIRPATAISQQTGTERPGKFYRPVRETNVPSSNRTLAPAETMPRP